MNNNNNINPLEYQYSFVFILREQKEALIYYNSLYIYISSQQKDKKALRPRHSKLILKCTDNEFKMRQMEGKTINETMMEF